MRRAPEAGGGGEKEEEDANGRRDQLKVLGITQSSVEIQKEEGMTSKRRRSDVINEQGRHEALVQGPASWARNSSPNLFSVNAVKAARQRERQSHMIVRYSID